METIVLQLITAFIGSASFCLVFNLRKQLIFIASLGSVLCWGVYLLGTYFYEGELLPCLLASAAAALYGEVLARIKKAPATLFLVTAVLPVIPGSKLYYTMSSVVQKDWIMAKEYGLLTVESAVAIAIGISLVWAGSVMLQNLLKNRFFVGCNETFKNE